MDSQKVQAGENEIRTSVTKARLQNQSRSIIRKEGTIELLKNNKSRVEGDFQVRFRERLAGEIPACLPDTGIEVVFLK